MRSSSRHRGLVVAAEILLVLGILGGVARLWMASPGPGPLGLVAGAVPAAFLWLRGRFPLPVLIAGVGCCGLAVLTSATTPVSVLTVVVAVYSYVVRHPRRKGMTVAGAALVVMTALALLNVAEDRRLNEPVPVAMSVALAAALGDSIRTRRAYIAEIVARAERAEATRESEAARRVTEERLRIARDLHDVVAHQISVISMNASVALVSLDARPEQTRSALHTIRRASKQAIGDIGDLLTVLRSHDGPTLDPQPGLAQLPDLVDDWARAGLTVTTHHDGSAPQLSPTVDMVAYRAIQEALTNAARHGAGARAHVLVSSTPGQVELVVTNPTDTESSDSDGFGLVGMRERVASVRGTMEYSTRGGTFRLAIRLPAAEPAEQL